MQSHLFSEINCELVIRTYDKSWMTSIIGLLELIVFFFFLIRSLFELMLFDHLFFGPHLFIYLGWFSFYRTWA